jgi:cyclic pyranopterin phosphate synthase
MIEIYAGSAFDSASKRGGWAAVVVENGSKKVFSGMVAETTKSRMDLTAVIEGLENTPALADMTLYTGSRNIYNTATRDVKRGANPDLWDRLDFEALQRGMTWQLVNGDSTNQYFKEALTLAAEALTKPKATEAFCDSEKNQSALELSHIDENGRPRMVDVSNKADTEREAIARAEVVMQPETLVLLRQGGLPKGDVLTVAQIAGIMGAKQVPSLIPLCHPLLLSSIKVEFSIFEPDTVEITSRVKNNGKTGVEMEALTAAAVAGLTIYDMCKAVDKGIRITNLRLVKKSGGKSGTIVLEEE